ncbi:hypothetical protein QO021_29365 (plasmid) [Pseudomonas amygdali pv. lachrymans]|uniref:hypothetical protein n=1 Tax=Pseudomonas amygdali TaxID=47877 RepID=UPI0006B8B08F|nr:hypothetical protein [Pseudomonas amygdali]KPC02175.1 Uncharacterized protein AC501_3461 [Pseudomonas amygdali pv. lachrymans]RMM39088.1 hypothetical protein ALQ79_200629 [Pseudomonas amygdali pv. lachrymans]WIO61670.1 hypothetical protein QO021_29365 [Pseudomonas amygdali pv. lachrymans]
MLIDFETVHRTYLKGCMDGGVWSFTPVNPAKPRTGKHLSTHQVFSNAGLGVALYLRNDFEGTRAIKVHAGLKLVFSRKVKGKFLLHEDGQKISLTLDMGGVRGLYAWLAGDTPHFSYEIIRPDAPKKQLSGFEADLEFPLSMRAFENDSDGSARSILVGLSDADIFHLQLHCLGLAKLLYPSLSDTALLAHMKPRLKAAPSCTPTNASPDPDNMGSGPTERPAEAHDPAIPASGEALPDLDPEQAKRAVFAVGKNRWPRKDIGTIEQIQNGPVEAMDRFVKAGNAGDFTEWDKIYNLLHPPRR